MSATRKRKPRGLPTVNAIFAEARDSYEKRYQDRQDQGLDSEDFLGYIDGFEKGANWMMSQLWDSVIPEIKDKIRERENRRKQIQHDRAAAKRDHVRSALDRIRLFEDGGPL